MDKTETINFTEGGLRLKQELPPPLVSIITVSYNVAATLAKCIESVKTQAFKNYEYIIIDGLSTDGTLAIIKRYDKAITYWRSEKDTGIYNAMNKAVKLARGKWFLFLGADDELLPGFSELTALLTDERCVYYGDFIF